jgi:hypothetical protein
MLWPELDEHGSGCLNEQGTQPMANSNIDCDSFQNLLPMTSGH